MRLRALAFLMGGPVACAACAAGTAAPSITPAPVTAAAPTLATGPAPAPKPESAPPSAIAPTPEPATVPEASPPPPPADTVPKPTSACNEQSPQDFLIRSNYLKETGGNQRAIQWRTDHYGWYRGFGRPGPDTRPPSAFVVDTTFMGLHVKMHEKVAPALQCVEEEIRLTCADHPYAAHALGGIRTRNTYHGGEVTNHIYGIAIDVDPAKNSCCGCVRPWSEAPLCKRPAKSEYDRMAMPECWVHAFERYGFYWLGHDVLRDTMHFEFLGDPDRILRSPGAGPGAVMGAPESRGDPAGGN